jgi:uncharacterized protein YodC (DUF2158 family)
MSPRQEFKDGDIVELRTGGPKMNGDSVGPRIVCSWSVAEKLQKADFNPATVVLTENAVAELVRSYLGRLGYGDSLPAQELARLAADELLRLRPQMEKK